MSRRGWKWSAVAGMLGLVLWFATRSAPEAASSGGQGHSGDSQAGAGLRLPALFHFAPAASGESSLHIRSVAVREEVDVDLGALVFGTE